MKHKRWTSAVGTILVILEAHNNGLIDTNMASSTINTILRCYGHYIKSSRITKLRSAYSAEHPELPTIEEHAVPVAEIVKHLLVQPIAGFSFDANVDRLTIEIQDYIVVVKITKDEDARLSKETMPINWTFGKSPWERYKNAGIQVICVD